LLLSTIYQSMAVLSTSQLIKSVIWFFQPSMALTLMDLLNSELELHQHFVTCL
jgi:hypothetical protein